MSRELDSMSAIEKIWRRILLAISRAKVTLTNDEGATQMMQLRVAGVSPAMQEIRDNIPRVAEYGFTSRPFPQADVIVLFVGGDRSNGVVVGTNDQRYRMKGLQSGEVAIYDDQGQSVYLTRAGIVVNGADLPITVNNVAGATVNSTGAPIVLNTPELRVSGDIIDNFETNAHTVAAMRAIYNEHNHPTAPTGPVSVPSVPQ